LLQPAAKRERTTVYIPNHFRIEDLATLQQYISAHNFGLLVLADENGIEANHVPFHLVKGEGGTLGQLQCHLSRSNPAWQRLQNSARVLVVFQGPHAYVSPSWYPTKAETGRVVPTWNYLAVHAEGSARVIEDPTWLHQHLQNLTSQQEASMPQPWAVDDAPADYVERLMSGIVGVEISITALSGKLKASQNHPEQNRAGVKAALAATASTLGQDLAKLIP
jgi:transcriptional regulator